MNVQSILARTGAGILGLSALVVALFLLGGSVTPARAQETETLMVGNLDQGTYQVHVGSGGQIAQPFCTTNAPATVSKVRIEMRPGYTEYPETLSLTIRADSSGTPGETVHTLTNSALFDDEIPTYEDFTSSGYELAADTMYWLVMETEHRDSLKLGVVRTTNESYAEDGWSIRGNLLLFYRGEWVDWPRSTRLGMSVYASGFAPSLLPPTFPDGDCNGVAEPSTFTLTENAAAGAIVGSVMATDPGNDPLTYTVSGRDATAFSQVFAISSTGEIAVKAGASPDFESTSSYYVTVNVADGKDASGNAESPAVTDASVAATIRVINIDEPGTILLAPSSPQVNSGVSVKVDDPDGELRVLSRTWYRADTAEGPFTFIGNGVHPDDFGDYDACPRGSIPACYLPTADDLGKFLKVTVTYFDGSSGPRDMYGQLRMFGHSREGRRSIEAIFANAVAAQSMSMQLRVANTGATGAPGIDGSPVVGQTLTANTSGIDDEDGLTGVDPVFQWIRHDLSSRTDEDIEGATSRTYTVTAGDEGKAIKVRVLFDDDAGNAESLTGDPTAAVAAAALELQSATVDGATLTLTYDGTLDTGVTLPQAAFAVNVNDASQSLTGVAVGGSNVLLLLSSAVEAGDTVTVDYTVPDGPLSFGTPSAGRRPPSAGTRSRTARLRPAPRAGTRLRTNPTA